MCLVCVHGIQMHDVIILLTEVNIIIHFLYAAHKLVQLGSESIDLELVWDLDLEQDWDLVSSKLDWVLVDSARLNVSRSREFRERVLSNDFGDPVPTEL